MSEPHDWTGTFRLERMLDERNAEIARLTRELEAAQRERDAARSDLDSYLGHHRATEQAWDAAEAECDRLRGLLERAREELGYYHGPACSVSCQNCALLAEIAQALGTPHA